MAARLSLLWFLLFCACVVPGASGSTSPPAVGSYTPLGVHLGVSQPESSSVFVTWTAAAAPPSSLDTVKGWVEWGPIPGSYGSSHPADPPSTYCQDCTPAWTGSIFRASMVNLAPSTRYYYRVAILVAGEDSQPSYSREFSFVTLPDSTTSTAADLTVLLLGDQGAYPSSQALLQKLQSPQVNVNSWADMVLAPGDLAYADGVESVWDLYANISEPLQATIPTCVSSGNHENYYDFAGYKNRFQFPQTNAPSSGRSSMNATALYYSFSVGTVHWVVISTEESITPGSPQYLWLMEELRNANEPERRTRTPWLVVVNHRPLYCSNEFKWCSGSDNAEGLRSILEPLLFAFRVNVFISGHVHSYERTSPVHQGNVTGSYEHPKATVHVITGTGGAELEEKWKAPPDWSLFRNNEFGFTKMTVSGTKSITFTQFSCGLQCSEDVRMVDSFTLYPAEWSGWVTSSAPPTSSPSHRLRGGGM